VCKSDSMDNLLLSKIHDEIETLRGQRVCQTFLCLSRWPITR
jgi:hypothetical protein